MPNPDTLRRTALFLEHDHHEAWLCFGLSCLYGLNCRAACCHA